MEPGAGFARFAPAVALIAFVGGLLRLLTMLRQPIGYDEDFTAVVLHADPFRMLDMLGRDSTPPLYYLLSWLPGQALSAAIAIRLVPAIAGVAAIVIVAVLARRAGGTGAGVAAAAVVAFLPATVSLSTFGRPYALAAAAVAASALLAWRAADLPSAGRWAAFAGTAAVALWSDYFAAPALAGVVVAAVWLRPSRSVATGALVSSAAAGLTLLPWLAFARAQMDHIGGAFWVPALGPAMLAGTAGQLFAGPPLPGSVPGWPALVALQAVAVGAGLTALAAVAAGWRQLGPESRRGATFLLLAASGVLLMTLASIARPILDARYADVAWMPVLAVLGIGLSYLPRPVAGALVAALAVPALALGLATTHRETSLLVPQIDASVRPGDLVAASPDQYLALLDEASPAARAELHVLSPAEPPWFYGTAAYPAGAVISEVPASVAAAGGQVLWVADPGSDPPGLPNGYRATGRTCVVAACLTVYAPGP